MSKTPDKCRDCGAADDELVLEREIVDDALGDVLAYRFRCTLCDAVDVVVPSKL